MATISRTFTVAADLQRTVAYLQDFSNAEEWEPGTVSCERHDDGEIRVGSTWHNASKIAGIGTELIYELIEQAPDRLRFIGTNKTATSDDTMEFRTVEGGTEITYTAQIIFNGMAKVADVPARLLFERVGGAVVDNLTSILGTPEG
ncbi:SRPBCC family protein [Corynebacterium variabile]|uniref:SRPBCC family protein n=1 Tax=Corynebacterium variabile TaxID=1727 RepID=UPI0028A64EC3|nr:SRPBCC family protein [Corynebacterium variabile]